MTFETAAHIGPFGTPGDIMAKVMGSIYPLMRMWYLAIFDWGGGGVQDVLKRLDQVQRPDQVLTDQEYDEISIDFYNDISAAIDMTMAFYDAIINQPASLRNYQTEYDPYYGDIIRLGIVLDKLHAVFAFMDVTEVFDYSPNIYTYVAMYDVPFGTRTRLWLRRSWIICWAVATTPSAGSVTWGLISLPGRPMEMISAKRWLERAHRHPSFRKSF